MQCGASKCKTGLVALHVVIVDDNEAFLDAARLLLEREHIQVVGVASTTADGLQRAAELLPDVVLVDVMLDGESGFELARSLVARDRLGGPAVILISTHAHEDLADLIVECPGTGFLSKSELSAAAIRRVLDVGSP